MENLKNEKILLELIDIVMGNKKIKELPKTELAFKNHDTYNKYSGYVYEIEHLLYKLGLFNYGNEFSNIYYLWNKYKYNLNHELVGNEELENELWGVLLNAELIHEEEQQSMSKEDIQQEEQYEDDFEEESEDEINVEESNKKEHKDEINVEESNKEEHKDEINVEESDKEEHKEEKIEDIDNSSWCVII